MPKQKKSQQGCKNIEKWLACSEALGVKIYSKISLVISPK